MRQLRGWTLEYIHRPRGEQGYGEEPGHEQGEVPAGADALIAGERVPGDAVIEDQAAAFEAICDGRWVRTSA